MTFDASLEVRTGSDISVGSSSSIRRVPRMLRFDGHRGGPVLDSASGGSIVPSSTSNPMESENLRTRCVILVSPGEAPPQPLVDLLRDQTTHPGSLIRAEHPLVAVARLAGLERDRRIREENLEGEWPPHGREKSILVVVNRDAWRDLAPLFATIKTLMPSVGIWVCTERIAIEIYAGDGTTDEDRDPAPADEAIESGQSSSSHAAPTDLDDELTEAELRDLLGHFETPDEDDFDDLLDSGNGGPTHP